MEQIGDPHQFERQFCPVENISTVAFQSLDTVRALHQTVVSLRTALEEAHKEIDNLKKQIVITSDIEEGKKYHKAEKHRQPQLTSNKNLDIESSTDSKEASTRSSSDKSNQVDNDGQVVPVDRESESSYIAISDEQINDSKEHLEFSDKKSNKKSSSKTSILIGEHHIYDRVKSKFYFTPREIQVTKNSKETNKHSAQMASKIDVKVKLTSNIRMDGGSSSDTTTESNSGKQSI